MTVTSRSMEPTITSNDIIVVNSKETYIELGTIITYYYLFENNPHRFIVTHRVIEIPEDYRTKGDANKNVDSHLVSHEDVVGTMCFKILYLGAIVHFANTKIGFLTLVIVPALVKYFKK